ncbi:MAG TPA: Stk1 family PASTA domain-containing Ser/Thr kinase [Candidatus Blautia avicola]|uniref:non-specific serine/threonine protein kinase n=1 Tax=Candidatus Blautia avicola TaxID=2838483 RepID=A0A9D2TW12_9FIRM|nr:Stk1 family PASTA domain-containing Ser/Thr kinase [Candidatus Blautia avicola]
MLNVGVIIGERYEVVSRIGSGGMADVYKAKDHKLNRFVAMKVLKPEFSADTNFIRKFQREAQAAAGLAHPNVVNVFDVGEDQGVNYIVMELVEGITLKEYISKKGRLTVKEATSIAIQVSMGLEAAHNRNIVHRDIKPQNIIISTDGKVKVTDFGIARVASSNTISTNAMGSVHYSSPEQVRGGYSDFKSDIYSLGITMYEMVTGRVPFDGDTTVAIAIKHLQDEMVPPSHYVPDLPHSLEDIILKCTQKSPDRRYSTLAELINDLKHSLIDPDGNFVNLSPLSNHAQTIMITPEEMKEIQNSGYSKNSDYDDGDEDEEEEAYDEDDDEDDDDDERGGINTKLEKAMTIGGLIIGAVIICILIYFVASAAGIVGGSKNSGQDTKTQQETTDEQEKVVVPDLTNMTPDEAQSAVKSLSLGLSKGGEEASDKVEEGKICRQDPAADTEVDPNTQITYYVSTGPADAEEEMVTIPTGLIGQTLSQVQSKLQELGLDPSNIKQERNADVAVGNVISLDPGEGSEVAVGTQVTITVSTGEGDTMTRIPDVRGYEEAQAVQIVEDQGLIANVEHSYSESAGVGYGQVYEMTPQGGQRIEQGSIITLKVLTEPEEEETDTDTQSEDEGTDTSTETSASSGTWATISNLKIREPENYDGQQLVRLRLVQGSEDAQGGTTILQDQTLTFDENGEYAVGQITGQSGESTGTLYFDVLDEDSGDYTTIWSYPLEFSQQ